MTEERIKYYQSKTNGAVFDDDCHLLTELDYPDLYYYDRDAARWARDFMEKTSHILEDGHNFSRGDNVKLLEWQNQSCCNVYGIKKKRDNLRRYHFEFDLKPKKQGKSPWSGMRANYHLMADDEGRGLIYAVAADKENGKIIHDSAKEQIIIEDELKKNFLSKRLVIRRDDIFHPKSRSRFKVISAESKTKHGPNLSALFADEPHSWMPYATADDRWNTLTKGIMARRQPLVGVTSTAGFKGDWFYLTKYDYAKKILQGHIRDDRWLVWLFEPDVQALIEKYGEEWDDERGLKPWYAYESVWKDINPSYGITVTKDYFEGEITLIQNAPENLNAFLRLHLNHFTGSTVEWTISSKWNLRKGEIIFSELRGTPCHVGIYTSVPSDITSMCLYFPEGNKFLWKFFSPRSAINSRKKTLPKFSEWVESGHVIEVEGNYISATEHCALIGRYLNEVTCLSLTYRSEDPDTAIEISKEFGIEVDPCSVVATDIKRATQLFQNMVKTEDMVHNGNPLMGYQVSMTEIQMKDETIRPHADNSRDNICGVFAGLLAVVGSMDAEPEKESASLSEGFISIDL